jgi:hypothetical protein
LQGSIERNGSSVSARLPVRVSASSSSCFETGPLSFLGPAFDSDANPGASSSRVGDSVSDSRASSSVRSSTPIFSPNPGADSTHRDFGQPHFEFPQSDLHGGFSPTPGLSTLPNQHTMRSSSHIDLPPDAFDLAAVRSPALSPSLGYIPATFPVTFPGPVASAWTPYSDTNQTHSELAAPSGRLDFSAFLATAFPELAHIHPTPLAQPFLDDSFVQHPVSEIPYYDLSFSSLQSHSTTVPPAEEPMGISFPVSYTARLSDVTALANRLRKSFKRDGAVALQQNEIGVKDAGKNKRNTPPMDRKHLTVPN